MGPGTVRSCARRYGDGKANRRLHGSEVNLEQFLEEKAGLYQGDGLAYLSDGRRLTKDNVRDMAGVDDQVRTPRLHRILRS